MDWPRLRAWWFAKQGLERFQPTPSAREVLRRTGWARSVGGANPYLSVFARSDNRVEEIHAELQDGDIQELPSARGCTYVLPRDDYALGLRVGAGFGEEAAIQTAVRFLGVTDEEVQALGRRVLEVVEAGPKDPKELKQALGDHVRNLGPEGKKRGQTTTLPLALGRLQQAGLIRRLPDGGRFDRQRYRYVRWQPSPLDGDTRDRDAAYVALARRYFQWIGPASLAQFRWFSGLGVQAAKRAIAPLHLAALEPDSDLLILPDELPAFQAFEPPTQPCIALVGSLDGLILLRRDLRSLVAEEDLERECYGEKGALRPIKGAIDLSNNAIIDRGRIIGIWEYDPGAGEIVSNLFVARTKLIQHEIRRTEGLIREGLGDCRSFSLDSPEARQPILEAIRAKMQTQG